jgi:hypothetical protein
MSEENIIHIDGKSIKESDLTPEQQHHKNHVISLRNKIGKLQFDIDELLPSLNFHEKALIETTKDKAEEVLESETKIIGET